MRTPEQVSAMPCPIDGTPLAMSDRQGVEIDYCPTCRGVWLDRGELDKIIERSEKENAPAPAPAPMAPAPRQQQPYGGYDDHGRGGYHHKKRRKSFLEELFD